MKKFTIRCCLIASIALTCSCGENKSAKETVNEVTTKAEAAGEKIGDKVGDAADKVGDKINDLSDGRDTGMQIDKKFVMKAASGGMMEVEAGKLAIANAMSAKVKEFGRMMVTDHTKANTQLKAVAAKKDIVLSTTLMEEHQKNIDMLKSKKGAEFDKAYIEMMLDDHKEDIEQFSDEASKGTDADVKAFATKTLPVLNKHLEHVKSIDATIKK
ncbi:MAG TPA: DUF4142 domain-containing protein [Segetibacter sp.]